MKMENQKKKQENPQHSKQQRKFSRPTTAIKHKKVLDNLTENGGNLSKAIRDTGLFSEEVATNPHKITESKTWKEVVEEFLPDDLLTQNHRELLEQKKVEYFVFPKAMLDDEIKSHVLSAGLTVIVIRESDKGKLAFYSIPDAQAKKGALEMAYKLKGRFTDESSDRPSNGNTYNFIFSAPVQEKIKAIEGEIKNMLIIKKNV